MDDDLDTKCPLSMKYCSSFNDLPAGSSHHNLHHNNLVNYGFPPYGQWEHKGEGMGDKGGGVGIREEGWGIREEGWGIREEGWG